VSEVSLIKFDRAFAIDFAPGSSTPLRLIKIKYKVMTLAKFEGKLIDKNEEISSSLFFSINKLLVLLALMIWLKNYRILYLKDRK